MPQSGPADVATVLSGLAEQAHLEFQNSGVSTRMSDPYFPGSALEQIQQVCDAADISHTIDRGTLYIWPRTGQRGSQVPLISPKSGLIGYPSYISQQIMISTLFNPSISYGQRIRVEQSTFPVANQEWLVQSLVHELDSMTPDGHWRTRIAAGRIDFSIVGPRL